MIGLGERVGRGEVTTAINVYSIVSSFIAILEPTRKLSNENAPSLEAEKRASTGSSLTRLVFSLRHHFFPAPPICTKHKKLDWRRHCAHCPIWLAPLARLIFMPSLLFSHSSSSAPGCELCRVNIAVPPASKLAVASSASTIDSLLLPKFFCATGRYPSSRTNTESKLNPNRQAKP
jgi:hypothetical protein